MKLTAFIVAIFLTLLLFFKFPRTIDEYKLSQSGDTVAVTIQRLPDCSSGYKNKFIHINYDNQTYILRSKCKYVQKLSEGQKVLMLHKSGTDIFLFREENIMFELIAVILIAIAVLFCLIFLFRPFKSKTKMRTTSASQKQGYRI
jgi:hypothetical protein